MATAAEIQRDLDLAVQIVTSRIAVNLLTGLRASTPVDTSYHSSRWVGRAGAEPPSRQTPGSRAGRAAQVNFAQHAASIAALRSYRLQQGDVFIGNDGDFIEELDGRENFVSPAVERSVTINLTGTGLLP